MVELSFDDDFRADERVEGGGHEPADEDVLGDGLSFSHVFTAEIRCGIKLGVFIRQMLEKTAASTDLQG